MREHFEGEFAVHRALPAHRNIVRLVAYFFDRLRDSLPGIKQFDALGDYTKNESLMLVLEYHPRTLEAVSRQLRRSGQLTVSSGKVCFSKQSLELKIIFYNFQIKE